MLASRCVRQEHAINFFLSLAEDLAEQQKALVASKKEKSKEKDALQVELSSRHAELSSCKQQCATYKDLNAKLKGKPSNQTCCCAALYAGKPVRAARACYQLFSFACRGFGGAAKGVGCKQEGDGRRAGRWLQVSRACTSVVGNVATDTCW